MWTSFFDTRVPIVVTYCSSNMFMTNRRTREVLPTAFSPTRQIFDLRRFIAKRCPRSVSPPASGGGYLTLLGHDVPDRDVHLDLLAVGHVEDDLALRHLRAEGRDVAVFEVVLDEPPDEGRLADRGLADQADLRLDPLHLGHGGHGSIPSGLLKTSAKKVDPREPFSPRSSWGRTMRLDHRVILALDVTDPSRARTIAGAVKSDVDAIKAGWALFLAGGADLIRELAGLGYLLADMRTAETPNTTRPIR